MKRLIWPAIILFLLGCKSQTPAKTVNLIDGESHFALPASSRVPTEILVKANIPLASADRILVNGEIVDPKIEIDCESCTIQIRRAITMTLVTPYEEVEIVTAAFTIGDALSELGVQLYDADFVDPPVGTPAADQITIIYRPSRELAIRVDGEILHIRSSAETVGAALIQGGIPLIGLDASQPPESDPLPADGQIRIIRVVERIELEQTEIPFEVEYVASNEIAIDQEEILTPGITGLIMRRDRVRYEDGVEVSRTSEEEQKVREPSKQVVGYGTKYVIQTITIDGQELKYWRSLNVYATSYSPCNSGADRCYPNTASGKPVQHGVIGVLRSWYNEMQGQGVYVPGYGYATIEDIGGGIEGKDWIDLGYSDASYQPWHHWVTIYFLVP